MKEKQLHDEIKRIIDTSRNKYWYGEVETGMKVISDRQELIEMVKRGDKIVCDAKWTTYTIEIGIVLKSWMEEEKKRDMMLIKEAEKDDQ